MYSFKLIFTPATASTFGVETINLKPSISCSPNAAFDSYCKHRRPVWIMRAVLITIRNTVCSTANPIESCTRLAKLSLRLSLTHQNKCDTVFRFNILRSPTYAPSASLLRILAVKIYVKWANHVVCTDTKRAIFKLWEKFWIWRFTKSWADLGPPAGDIIGHVNKVPTMHFLTSISRNTQSKSSCSHRPSVSGNSETMHCGILINMPYWWQECLTIKIWTNQLTFIS